MMLDKPITTHKAQLIEQAFAIKPFQSFADLGGCWGVNGGYAVHARKISGEKFERGLIVDQHITPLTRERVENLSGMELVDTILGSGEARRAVGKVDR